MRLARSLRPQAVVFIALMALVPLAAFDPSTTWWFPSCPFQALTGWLCPLCGSLRAIHALATGAPLTALAFNPLTVVLLGAGTIARSRTVALCFSGRGLALLAGFGLLRNL